MQLNIILVIQGYKNRVTIKIKFTSLIELINKSILALTHIRGAYDKFPDFFPMGTFIDSTHMKL